jgi:hypothetical protein
LEKKMKGIRFLVDDKGEPEAVVLDLKKHGRLWEDFQDLLISQQRLKEPRVSWAGVNARLRKKGLLP